MNRRLVNPELVKHYPYVYAWCIYTSCFPYYTEQQIHRAIAEGAPKTAIYCNLNGKWSTYEEITNPIARAGVDTIINELQQPIL
jgi:hypothetical protein